MNFIEMMEKRHSCRVYSDKPVSKEAIESIIEAGRLSPSACNSQPWKFIVVESDDARKKICDALVLEDGSSACGFRESVPVFIIMVELPANVMPLVETYYHDRQRFAQGDLGMAAMNMAYAAMDQGLDTCFLGICDQKKMEKHFGIPEGYTVRLTMAVGYGAEKNPTPAKNRKSTEEICSYNAW